MKNVNNVSVAVLATLVVVAASAGPAFADEAKSEDTGAMECHPRICCRRAMTCDERRCSPEEKYSDEDTEEAQECLPWQCWSSMLGRGVFWGGGLGAAFGFGSRNLWVGLGAGAIGLGAGMADALGSSPHCPHFPETGDSVGVGVPDEGPSFPPGVYMPVAPATPEVPGLEEPEPLYPTVPAPDVCPGGGDLGAIFGAGPGFGAGFGFGGGSFGAGGFSLGGFGG